VYIYTGIGGVEDLKKIISSFFLLFLMVSSLLAGEEYLADPAAEPSDFRGIKWQQNLDTLGDMAEKYREESEDEITCTRRNEEMTFGNANLDSIEYIFYNRKLSKIAVVAKGKSNEDALLEEALAILGKETIHSNDDYMWRFTDVAVMFSREPQLEQSVLFYQYIGFLKNK
jgi:hypothetical protein